MGGGARSAPFSVAMNAKKTGARSARARTRGQNPLVAKIVLFLLGKISYYFHLKYNALIGEWLQNVQ